MNEENNCLNEQKEEIVYSYVVGVSFKKALQVYYFGTNDATLKIGDHVVVETARGLELGLIKVGLKTLQEVKLKAELKPVLRIATKQDVDKYAENEILAQKAHEICLSCISQLNLSMHLISSEYVLDTTKVIFTYVSDDRVDFRELAKELAAIYKVRIELRQIGVRDKAKEVGGCGLCGQKLCCARFLKDLDTVSINMAKNQNLSLNPSKINGVCGRLLCCLKYEDENYKECRECMLKIGDKIKTEFGEGKIIGIELLKGKYKVDIPDYGIVTIDKETCK